MIFFGQVGRVDQAVHRVLQPDPRPRRQKEKVRQPWTTKRWRWTKFGPVSRACTRLQMATWLLSGTTSWTRRTSTQPLGDGRWSRSRDSSAKLLWSSPLTWFVRNVKKWVCIKHQIAFSYGGINYNCLGLGVSAASFCSGGRRGKRGDFVCQSFCFVVVDIALCVTLILLLVLTFWWCKWEEEAVVDDRKVDHVHKFIDSNLDDDLEKDDDAAKVEDIVLEKDEIIILKNTTPTFLN